MSNRKRTLARNTAAAGVAAVGLTVGGIGLANAADDSGSGSDSTSQGPSTSDQTGDQRQGPGGHRGPGGPGVHDSAALAKALGVSESDLEDALDAVRDELRPSAPPSSGSKPTPPTDADREQQQAQLAAALAKELDLTEAKVTAALDEVRGAERAEHRTDLADRLDDAVDGGDLTAADKASVLKAYDAGVLGLR